MNIEAFRQFLNFCAVYLATLLGRSLLCSYFILALALVLRRTILKKPIFLRGFLWALFLLAPFVGKLKLFYENPFAKAYQSALFCQGVGRIAIYPLKALAFLTRLFFGWGNLCVEQPWICWMYLLGVAVSFLLLCRQKRKMKKLVSKMVRYESLEGSFKKDFHEPYGLSSGIFSLNPADTAHVWISELAITPFSMGLVHPRIVLPEVVLKDCSREEIELMMLHEKVHIRLGHLWCYFVWDLLRCLFWLNPFLTACTRYLREDLEDICDRVTIQQSGKKPCEYGKLLLKTVRLLQKERMAFTMAFAGEKGYGEFRRRIQKIMGFRPYQGKRAACLCVTCLLALAGMFTAIRHSSYPNYVEMDVYFLMSGTGDRILIDDSDALKGAVSRDGQNVYIEQEAMEALLQEYGIAERTFYLGFGGYMKLPGMGGGGCCIYVDCEENQGNLVIPYQGQKDILSRILKVL